MRKADMCLITVPKTFPSGLPGGGREPAFLHQVVEFTVQAKFTECSFTFHLALKVLNKSKSKRTQIHGVKFPDTHISGQNCSHTQQQGR